MSTFMAAFTEIYSACFKQNLWLQKFGIENKGRVLIADDMGLGKTIQAIGISLYFRNEWPVLVICPASVKMSWHQHFLLYTPSIEEDSINIAFTGKDNPTKGQVNIISYDLASRLCDTLKNKNFNVIIADESHLLKSRTAQRTKNIVPLLQRARRAILLSGTPALSRPKELFTQISALDKRLFPNYFGYSMRYCDGKQGQFGLEDNGCSNYEELNSILQCTVMIRRLKEDVLLDLPEKWRSIIVIDPSLIRRTRELAEAEKCVTTMTDRNMAIRKYYQVTATVKAKGVCEFVSNKLEQQQKLLVFAHHHSMLDAVEEMARNKGIVYIRIDGSTNPKDRQNLVNYFNEDLSCTLAILSITAAGQGLTLTGSSLVIFAELYWNPGHLIQAEDRVHRIGQRRSVTIIYLVARNTADDYIWVLVKDKLNVLTNLGIGKKKGLDGVTVEFTDPRQKKILECFSELDASDVQLMNWANSQDEPGPSGPSQKRSKPS